MRVGDQRAGGATHDVPGTVVDVAGGEVVDVVEVGVEVVVVEVRVDEVVGAAEPPGDAVHAESTRPAVAMASTDVPARRRRALPTVTVPAVVPPPRAHCSTPVATGGRAWSARRGSPRTGGLPAGELGP
jgi:hypothetical protein